MKGKTVYYLKKITMKKYLTITMALMLCLSLTSTQAQEEMQYLFGGKDKDVSISGFGAIFNEFSAVDNDFAFLMGGGAALLVDQRFFLGAYGMGLTTRHMNSYWRYDYNLEKNIYSGDLYTRFGHGGFWLGYIHNPKKAIHWGANLKLGWGSITLNELENPGSDYYKWKNYDADNVFVVTPQFDMGLNLLKWMRVNVGVGYRLVTGVNKTYLYLPDGATTPVEKPYFDSNAFSNFTGNITLAFGWFGK
jgi:hypothetical protein